MVGHGGQAGQGDVGVLHHLRGGGACGCALLGEGVDLFLFEVEDGEGVPGFEQVAGHAAAHGAHADKPEGGKVCLFAHGGFLFGAGRGNRALTVIPARL